MSCGITDPLSCVGQLAGAAAGGAWDAICLSFAAAADTLLKAFARAFTAIPPVDLSSPGVKNVYAICLGIAAVIAALLLLGQVIRTALTHDGSGLAEGLAGVGKAAAAFMLTLVIAAAAVTAADGLTTYIIDRSFGSAAALTARITGLLSFTGAAGQPDAEAAGSASLLLLLAIIGILLILVLWFELLLRNAAIAVLVATSPIGAAGQVSAATRSWWPKMASATAQLIILKPVIALIFALGLGLTGRSRDIETLLAGMLILLLAVVAWPVVARFLTFATAGAGSAGLGAVLGFAAGRLSGAGGGLPAGMAGGPSAEAAGTAGTAGAQAAAGAATAGVLGLAAAGIQAAHKTAAALAGRMDQVADHAGLASSGYGLTGSAAGTPRYARPAGREQPDGDPPGAAGPFGPGRDAPGEWAAREGAGDWPEHYPAESGDGRAAEPAAFAAEPVPEPGWEDWPEHYPAGTGDGWATGHFTEPASPASSEGPASPPAGGPRAGSGPGPGAAGPGTGAAGSDDRPLPPAPGGSRGPGETTEDEERS
jgi:hypothetical protein